MSLNTDTLIQIISLKKQLSKWRIIAIIFAVIAVFVFFEKASNYSPIKSDYIARITINGIIDDNPKLNKLLEETTKDKHVKAVIVWLDTPGGGAVGGQEIYLALLKMSKVKPVVAVIRTMAASAGYMIALGTDHIIAREGSITGSIGVIIETFEATELANKIGVKPIIVKSGPYKASPNPMEKYTPEQDAVMQIVIKDFFNWFVDIVAERRKFTREVAMNLADGRIYTGRQALKEKLIDQIGGEEEAVDWLNKNKKISQALEIKDVKVSADSDSIFEQFNQMAKGKFATFLPQRLDGLNALWQAN
ncbi:MAG: signal peptide peptidase SppA [Pseudomonadota bacterium]